MSDADFTPLPWDNGHTPSARELVEAMATAIVEMGESTYVPLQFKQHRLLLEARRFLYRPAPSDDEGAPL